MTTENESKLTFEQGCYLWASSFYLFNTLEEDFFELSEEDQHKQLEENAWEPFEYYDGYKIDSFIDELAAHIIDKQYPEKED